MSTILSKYFLIFAKENFCVKFVEKKLKSVKNIKNMFCETKPEPKL